MFKQVVFDEEDFAGQYRTFRDEEHFKTNRFLANQNSISLGVYINSFEISNLLGTSRKIHKITAVYWVILNLSAQFHSSLSTIQLAVLG